MTTAKNKSNRGIDAKCFHALCDMIEGDLDGAIRVAEEIRCDSKYSRILDRSIELAMEAFEGKAKSAAMISLAANKWLTNPPAGGDKGSGTRRLIRLLREGHFSND